jgi:hypothetical protein
MKKHLKLICEAAETHYTRLARGGFTGQPPGDGSVAWVLLPDPAISLPTCQPSTHLQ